MCGKGMCQFAVGENLSRLPCGRDSLDKTLWSTESGFPNSFCFLCLVQRCLSERSLVPVEKLNWLDCETLLYCRGEFVGLHGRALLLTVCVYCVLGFGTCALSPKAEPS